MRPQPIVLVHADRRRRVVR